MEVDVDRDDIVDSFKLDRDELAQLRNKSAETRLGFALQMKFLGWRGRFPEGPSEIPGDAVGYVARQVDVDPGGIALYDFVGRAAQRHRKEIRAVSGFRPCTVSDAEQLTGWLVENSAKTERREEQVRADLLARCRAERIEPPADERIGRIVRSALHQAEDALMRQTVARLDAAPGTDGRLDALVEADESVDEADTVDDLLATIKADPGTVGLKSMKAETSKLASVRAIGFTPACASALALGHITALTVHDLVELNVADVRPDCKGVTSGSKQWTIPPSLAAPVRSQLLSRLQVGAGPEDPLFVNHYKWRASPYEPHTWLQDAVSQGPRRRYAQRFFPHIIGGHRLAIVGSAREVTRPDTGYLRPD
jgi:hypothetical protein